MLSNSRRLSVEKDVRSELGGLPADLKQQYAIIYKDVLESAESTASIAQRVFSWILAAQRALTVEELLLPWPSMRMGTITQTLISLGFSTYAAI
jgi:hypothetical protein